MKEIKIFEISNKFQKLDIIMITKFGSTLYGTNDKNSDIDLKGIFLPSKEEILLNRIPKNISFSTKIDNKQKNSKGDIDIDMYSLHKFINLACNGETIALDMLHATENMIIEKNYIWDAIVEDRSKFYTKNLKAFVSYARKQAAKYGIKGSRLSDARHVLVFFKSIDESLTLKEIWDALPKGEHIHFLPPNQRSRFQEYQVCGKRFQETCKISYVIPILEQFVNSYGERARQAEENCGIDWKAVSHALRAAYQVKSILTQGTIIFPLKEASFLKKVKRGELHFTREVSPILEGLMDEIEELSEKSTLPVKSDREFWDQFIVNILLQEKFR